ncbi:hypothetical protein ANO14919_012880 [Xylariales sp. No.14919]|nr:hypothetical protein ANO14919_012880 [Xylariales sp. No.14919]
MSLQLTRFWIFLWAGIELPGAPLLDDRARLARRTGVGLFSPPGNSLVDVVRHEWYLLLGLLSLLAAGAWSLHAIIQPQHIYNIKYVLAVVYMIYAVGVLALTRRGSREVGNVFNGLPPVECEICAASDPLDTLITMECFTEAELAQDPERVLPVFHQECLLEAWRTSLRTSGLCLHCQRPALRWHVTYGRLASTRLIEYINSLFARLIPLIWPVFDGVIALDEDFAGVISPHRQRHYIRTLSMVLPMHMILTTMVILSLQCLYMIYSSPAHIAVRTAYLMFAVLVLVNLSAPVSALYSFRRDAFPFLIPELANTVNYFFVRERPAGSPMALSLLAFAQRQLLTFLVIPLAMSTLGSS